MEDRLSELPECLLHRILSFLPLEDQLKTSVLSRKWLNICSTNHILNLFTSCEAPRSQTTLARAVDRCLRLSTSSPPLAIRIDVHQQHHLDRWIRSASLRSVRDLGLRVCTICHGFGKRETLPEPIYSCVSVTSLKLIGVAFLPPPPDFKGFPFLKKLHLRSVDISNEALRLILSMSPLLETVKMFGCRPSRGRTAVSEMYVIEGAPSLKHFACNIDPLMLRVKNVPLLHEVSIEFDDKYEWSRWDWLPCCEWFGLLSGFSHVQVLTIGAWFFKHKFNEGYMSQRGPTLFKNLRELHCEIGFNDLCTVVSNLGGIPSLEKLCIHFEEKTIEDKLEYLGFDDNSDGDCDDGDGVDELPEYSMSYLKRVTVAYFCDDEVLLGLLRYILRNAVVLESLVLQSFPDPDIHMKNLVAQVKRYPRISPFAQVLFSTYSEAEFCQKNSEMWENALGFDSL